LHAMTGQPRSLAVAVTACLLAVPLGQTLALAVKSPRAASMAVVEAAAAGAVTALVAAVYLVVVVGINGAPHGHERTVLIASLCAAVVVALLAVPVRRATTTAAQRLDQHG